MPAYVQFQAINRFVPIRITVRPDGTLQDCSQDRSSGDSRLDLYTCGLILKRAKFQAATWIDGTSAYGIVRVPVSWIVGGYSKSEIEHAYPADMQIYVNQLPKGAGKRTKLRLTLAVAPDGKVNSCAEAALAPEESKIRKFPELVPLACGQMTATFRAVPAMDTAGNPVRSVQPAVVLFSINK